MTTVIAILIVLLIASAVAYAKVPAFKALVDKQLEKLKKKPVAQAATNVAPVTTPAAAASVARAAPFTGLVTKDREAEYNAWRDAQPAHLQFAIPPFDAALFRDTQVADAANRPAGDRSGFDFLWVNDPKGNTRINRLYPGSTYSYSFDIPAGFTGAAELTIGITADGGVIPLTSWVSDLPGETGDKQSGDLNNTRKHFATGAGKKYLNLKVGSVAGPSVQLNHG